MWPNASFVLTDLVRYRPLEAAVAGSRMIYLPHPQNSAPSAVAVVSFTADGFVAFWSGRGSKCQNLRINAAPKHWKLAVQT
jgi:uncharacterized membrane protein